MISKKIKNTVLIFMTLIFAVSTAQIMTEVVNTELQEVDVSNSSVVINGKRYKYQLNKNESLFNHSDLKPQSLRSLIKGKKYYFELQQNYDGKSTNPNSKAVIIFISEEELPE